MNQYKNKIINSKQSYPFVNQISLREASKILGGVAHITISRIAISDPDFPIIMRSGRSSYINCFALYSWLSKKSGYEVSPCDIALRSKDLQIIFDRSHTWIWSSVKAGVLPKPFKINRSTFWMKSQIDELLDAEIQQDTKNT